MDSNFTPKQKALFNTKAYEEDWLKRPVLQAGKYKVPAYHKGNDRDGYFNFDYDTNPIPTTITDYIIENKEQYRNKRFLDIGCGTGLVSIILTDHGFSVKGVDYSVNNLTGALYTMSLNNVYYDIVYSNETYADKHDDYDVVLCNAVFRVWAMVDSIVPMMRRVRSRGKEVIFWTEKDPRKLWNFEKFRPVDAKPLDTTKELF
jgi:2-polyprenyl-3-methyl-5-hydroxy-6-metoxy-1,4-benzoquinol methylase